MRESLLPDNGLRRRNKISLLNNANYRKTQATPEELDYYEAFAIRRALLMPNDPRWELSKHLRPETLSAYEAGRQDLHPHLPPRLQRMQKEFLRKAALVSPNLNPKPTDKNSPEE
jgi:hypothetical protein